MVFSKCHARLMDPPLRLPPSIYPFSPFLCSPCGGYLLLCFFLPRALFTSAIDRHAARAAAARSLSQPFFPFSLSSTRPAASACARADVWLSLYPPTPLPLICSLASSAAVCLERGCILPISRASSVHHEAATQLTFSNYLSLFSPSSFCIASSK